MSLLRLDEKGNGLEIAVVVMVSLVWSANGEITASSGRLIDPTIVCLTITLLRTARLQHKIIYVRKRVSPKNVENRTGRKGDKIH